jgi:hypothetical protein
MQSDTLAVRTADKAAAIFLDFPVTSPCNHLFFVFGRPTYYNKAATVFVTEKKSPLYKKYRGDFPHKKKEGET